MHHGPLVLSACPRVCVCEVCGCVCVGGWVGARGSHLEGLQPGLLLLQGQVLLLLVHAAEGHAGVGEGRHGTRQGAGSAGADHRGAHTHTQPEPRVFPQDPIQTDSHYRGGGEELIATFQTAVLAHRRFARYPKCSNRQMRQTLTRAQTPACYPGHWILRNTARWQFSKGLLKYRIGPRFAGGPALRAAPL